MSTSLVPVLTFTERTYRHITLKCRTIRHVPDGGSLTVELFSSDGKSYQAKETYISPLIRGCSHSRTRWCSHIIGVEYSQQRHEGDAHVRANSQLRIRDPLRGYSIGLRDTCLAADDTFLAEKWALWRGAYLSVALLKYLKDLPQDVKSQVADWVIRVSQAELTTEFPCY